MTDPCIAIVIPARMASTRFPGKPLHQIAGKAMLQRVHEIATHAVADIPNVHICVATESETIYQFCREQAITAVMTSESCRSGSDRALEAVANLKLKPDYVINLQGDAPLTPPAFIQRLVERMRQNPPIEVVTPVVQLSWVMLDKLREHKQRNPFSGTTVIVDRKQQKARWFSKNIIPGLRHEQRMRAETDLSPVYRHIGLYGYSYQALQGFADLPEGTYEQYEGLEQLRFLENGVEIDLVLVSYGDYPALTGVDTQDDALNVEAVLKEYGEVRDYPFSNPTW